MAFEKIRFGGESIPGARGEAIVAAVNAVADGGAEFDWNRAFQFDGEVRNTAARVELERRGDGGGRAGGDAADAGSAAVAFGRVGFDFRGRDNFGEEKPVAEFFADQVSVFADEADAGALG